MKKSLRCRLKAVKAKLCVCVCRKGREREREMSLKAQTEEIGTLFSFRHIMVRWSV